MATTTPYNKTLFKTFKLADELVIAEFDFGLTKSKLLLTQKYLAAYNKIQSAKDILIRYEQLISIHLDHNKCTITFGYKRELSDLSALDDSTYKLRSIESLHAALYIATQMFQNVPHEKELLITIDKSSKERKQEQQSGTDSTTIVKVAPPVPSAKPQRSRSNGMFRGSMSIPLDISCLVNVKGELIERVLEFQASELVIKLTPKQSKTDKTPEKSSITIPYPDIKTLTIDTRPYFVLLTYGKKKKTETIEIWTMKYVDVWRQLAPFGAYSLEFSEHGEIWANKTELSQIETNTSPVTPPVKDNSDDAKEKRRKEKEEKERKKREEKEREEREQRELEEKKRKEKEEQERKKREEKEEKERKKREEKEREERELKELEEKKRKEKEEKERKKREEEEQKRKEKEEKERKKREEKEKQKKDPIKDSSNKDLKKDDKKDDKKKDEKKDSIVTKNKDMPIMGMAPASFHKKSSSMPTSSATTPDTDSHQPFNPLMRATISETRSTGGSFSGSSNNDSAKNVLKTTVVETNQLTDDGKLIMARKPGSGAKGKKRRPPTKKVTVNDLPTDETGIDAPSV
jgi:hypothetical protein